MFFSYLINHLGQTGVNNVVLDLVKQMTAHGHQCCVYYFKDTPQSLDYPCETRKVQGKGIDFNAWDVIHTHGLKANLYVLRHKPRNCKAKCVATLHCYAFQDFKDLYGAIQGFLLGLLFLLSVKKHDKVVTLSQDAMQYYSKWIRREKLTYVYNTRDLDVKADLTEKEKRELLNFKGQNSILIGMNCVLLIRKGIDVMLQAMRLLPTKYKLFIAGDGKEKENFKKMAEAYKLSDRVYFAGNRPNAYRYLPYYDIYALPSRSEGFPLSLLEAAVYQTKVVASRLPIVEECFSDEQVVKFRMPNAEELAKSIERAVKSNVLGSNLYQRFVDDYSPSVFYQKYLQIYTD